MCVVMFKKKIEFINMFACELKLKRCSNRMRKKLIMDYSHGLGVKLTESMIKEIMV